MIVDASGQSSIFQPQGNRDNTVPEVVHQIFRSQFQVSNLILGTCRHGHGDEMMSDDLWMHAGASRWITRLFTNNRILSNSFYGLARKFGWGEHKPQIYCIFRDRNFYPIYPKSLTIHANEFWPFGQKNDCYIRVRYIRIMLISIHVQEHNILVSHIKLRVSRLISWKGSLTFRFGGTVDLQCITQ